MSETETGATPAPDDAPVPVTEDAPQTAQDAQEGQGEGAQTEAPDPEAEQRKTRAEKRFAVLNARLAAQQAELDALRQAQQRPAQQSGEPLAPEVEALVEQRAAAKVALREAELKREAFHAAGRAANADWDARCQALVEMGADAGMADLLIDMPDGSRVAAALHDEPEELERIAAIKSERGRAIALGKFAATLEGKAPPPVRRVSGAPPPIRPVTGRATPTFNEYTADANTLAEFYAKQAMDRRLTARK
jgi:hypothetical protein